MIEFFPDQTWFYIDEDEYGFTYKIVSVHNGHVHSVEILDSGERSDYMISTPLDFFHSPTRGFLTMDPEEFEAYEVHGS